MKGSKRIGLVILLVATGVASGHAQSRSRSAVQAAIDSVVQSYLAGGRVAGMSVAVVRGRDTLALKAYGSADLELDVPTPPRAVYEIGSVTKQFTGAAMMLLQEDGTLSLDDDLTKYMPDYPTHGYKIPLRRLLDHTSGIKGFTELPAFAAMRMRKVPRDSIVALFKNEPFDFAPGDAEIYSNSAYYLAGLVIEKASGLSYADFVSRRLFAKAGMTDSRYCSESAIIKRKAHGYDTRAQVLVNKAYIDHDHPYAAGSLCSTAGDLVAWNQALHGGRVLSAASYREFITPSVLNDGTVLRYAKGLAVHTLGGHRAIEHGGVINGYLSESAYFPDHDAIIVVLMNTNGPVSPFTVATSLADVVFGKVDIATKPAAADFASLAGTYTGVGRGRVMTVTITSDNARLMAALFNRQPVALQHLGDNVWYRNDTLYTFRRASTGEQTLRFDAAYGLSVLSRTP